MYNLGGGCSATEQIFVNKSVACYACLVNFACLDDALYGDTNNECEDVPGAATGGDQVGVSNATLCLEKINCVMTTSCASTDVASCYCGSFEGTACATQSQPADGRCAALEAEGVNHFPSDPASVVSPLLGNRNSAAGKGDAIFSCSVINGCSPLCNQ